MTTGQHVQKAQIYFDPRLSTGHQGTSPTLEPLPARRTGTDGVSCDFITSRPGEGLTAWAERKEAGGRFVGGEGRCVEIKKLEASHVPIPLLSHRSSRPPCPSSRKQNQRPCNEKREDLALLRTYRALRMREKPPLPARCSPCWPVLLLSFNRPD